MGNSYDNANIGHVQDAVNASFGNGKYSVSFADDSSSSSGGSGVHWEVVLVMVIVVMAVHHLALALRWRIKPKICI